MCQVWDAVMTLNEGQGHQIKINKILCRPLVALSLVGLSSQQTLSWALLEVKQFMK